MSYDLAEGETPGAPFRDATDIGTIPRDTTEAKHFLQLSQAEGRAPLFDALIGRATLDRLDFEIESGGPNKIYAEELKRQLLEQFNEMAPPATLGG